MAERPSGHVAFLFTDLEASTRLWEHRPQEMPRVYTRHDAILRGAIESRGGVVYKVIGDAFQVAFHTAHDAMHAAIDAQRQLSCEPWPITPAPRVRMALHLCEVEPQVDAFDTLEEVLEDGPPIGEIGVEFDPDDLLARYREGVPASTLLEQDPSRGRDLRPGRSPA